jgi:hypothetical protein
MPTVAGNVPEQGLNRLEFAKARKDIALGRLTQAQWSKASIEQQKILHQIELAIISITLEDLSELDESDQ